MAELQSDGRFFSPGTLEEALAIRAAEGNRVRVLAGGTDLMVEQNRSREEGPPNFLSVWGISGLRGIRRTLTHLEIGALTTYTELIRSSEVATLFPALVKAARNVGAAQIQNRGTIGGNVANASPAGDTLPVLAVADAVLFLESKARGVRLVPVRDFFTGYRKTVLEDDELLTRIELPLPASITRSGFEKVGSRRAQTISKVVAAIQARFNSEGRMEDVALAFGSIAPTVIRLPRTEAALNGNFPSLTLAERVSAILQGEIHPIDDIRSTADYRRFVSLGLLKRFMRNWESVS